MFVCYTEVLCLHHMAGAASVISWAMSIHPFHRTVTVTPRVMNTLSCEILQYFFIIMWPVSALAELLFSFSV